MNYLARKLVDLWQALARWYYNWRYGAVARKLETPEDRARRGFIIVQIDGLSYEQLQNAVAQGYAPYLATLLRSGDGECFRWCCGLPSTTPAVQAGIMFGSRYDVPGFRWYVKETQSSVVCKYPGALNAVQQRLYEGRAGILEKGASYANMFDGGATTSLFTLAAIGRTSLLEKVGGLGLFFVMLFSPLRVLRILWWSIWTYLSSAWRQLTSVFWPNKFSRIGLLTPFTSVLTDVVVREVETFASLVDVYRGVPAIWVNYSSYDEWAHIFGPGDHYAYQAVRAIDAQIRQIDRMRRRMARREYDLFVLSDHGMAPCVPFDKAFGSSFSQLIVDYAGKPLVTDETMNGARHAPAARALLEDEIAIAEGRLTGLSSGAARAVKKSLARRGEREPSGPARPTDVVVRNSGPLSHIYLNLSQAPMLLEEIEEAYPGFVERLAAHPGIGVVAVRSAEGPYMFTREGRYSCAGPPLPPSLLALREGELTSAELAKLLSYPHSGDLVVLGRWSVWDNENLVVSFEKQQGTHGGVGGEQCFPFLLAVAQSPRNFSLADGPEDLYRFFLSYGQAALAAERPAEKGEAQVVPSVKLAGRP